MVENDDLKGELYELEKELNEKNRNIKLLTLKLNRREVQNPYDRRWFKLDLFLDNVKSHIRKQSSESNE